MTIRISLEPCDWRDDCGGGRRLPEKNISQIQYPRGVDHGDDFAMMREVLTRRFRRLIDEDPDKSSGLWPDLVLIDGGAGQLNKVAQVCRNSVCRMFAWSASPKAPTATPGANNSSCRGVNRFNLRPTTPFCITCNACATRRIALPLAPIAHARQGYRRVAPGRHPRHRRHAQTRFTAPFRLSQSGRNRLNRRSAAHPRHQPRNRAKDL